MLKEIPKDQVQLGMFIHALRGAWASHPFWRAKFILADPEDLDALRSSRVKVVVVDTSRGLDVAPAPDKLQHSSSPEPHGQEGRATKQKRVVRRPRSSPSIDGPCSLADEIDRAALILAGAREVAEAFWSEAGLKNRLSLLEPTLDAIAGSVARNPAALISLARERPNEAFATNKAVAMTGLMIALGRQLGFGEKALQAAGVGCFQVAPGNALAAFAAAATTTGEGTSDRPLPLLGTDSSGQPVAAATDLAHFRDSLVELDRLTENEIKIFCDMRLVCDGYDNMTYLREGFEMCTPAEAVSELYRFKQHFEEYVLNAFIRTVGIYPVGSLVRLQSDHLAIVAEQNAHALREPLVCQFFSIADKDWACLIDLKPAAMDDRIVSRESPQRWGLLNLGREWISLVTMGLRPTRD